MTRSAEVGRAGLMVDGREELLFSAEVHPWRLERAHWGEILDVIRGLGFTTVCTYISWAMHEVARGEFDFDGTLDIEHFLGLVHARGMRAVVRVGPNTAAEQENSGWPWRILDDPDCQARRSNGQPYVLLSSTGHCFPPSYASKVVLDEIGRWYDEIIGRLAPLQHPDGPIVLCQVDNELGYHFQANAYALDYHPDAIEQYRAFVGRPDAEPPRDADDGTEEERVAWVAWKEEHLRATLRRLADMIRARGMDRIPLFHNDYPRLVSPQDLGALEASGAVDIAAADIYVTREGGRFLRDVCRHLAGSSRLPFLAELGAGWLSLPWLLPLGLSGHDEEANSLRAVVSGVRAGNVYMLVERDRWYGSPVAEDGSLRPNAAFYPRLIQLLAELDWLSLQRESNVLLVENRAETRRVATRDTLGGVVPSFHQLLPIDLRLTQVAHADTAEFRAWEHGLATALDAAGVDFDRASSEAMPPDLTAYSLIVMPVLGAVSPGAWARLEDAAARGVTVAVGPALPVGVHGEDTGVRLLQDPAAAGALAPIGEFHCDDPTVDLCVWRGEARVVVCASSASATPLTAEITFAGSARFHGRWEPEVLSGDGRVSFRLEPWSTQIWEVER